MANKMKPQGKINIRKDDIVKVIAGDSKTEQGKVLFIDRKKRRAIVEGVNIVSRHTKPTQDNPNGGIVKKEAAVDISNLMLVDPKTNEPTRVGKKLVDGKLKRYSKKTGEIID